MDLKLTGRLKFPHRSETTPYPYPAYIDFKGYQSAEHVHHKFN